MYDAYEAMSNHNLAVFFFSRSFSANLPTGSSTDVTRVNNQVEPQGVDAFDPPLVDRHSVTVPLDSAVSFF